MDLFLYLKKEKEKIEKDIRELSELIRKYPKEKLFFHKQGKYKYPNLYTGSGNYTHLKRKDYEVLLPLMKKTYYQRRLNYSQMYLNAINAFLDCFNPNMKNAEDFLQSIPPFAKKMLSEDLQKQVAEHDWSQAPYAKSQSHPETLIYQTVRGEKVRSKSECMIADMLLSYGISYRYEWTQNFCGMHISPDFTIIHPITKDLIIWEHFGLLDDENYSIIAEKKITVFAKSGYIPGRNLIISAETAENPLDSLTIDKIIHQYLL